MREVVVSLTSCGERLNVLPKVIKSLLKQTYQVNTVTLWLDETHLTKEQLPQELMALEGKQFQICFFDAKQNISPSLKAQSDDLLIMVGDDVIYGADFIANLIKTHENYPDAIIATRAKLFKVDSSLQTIESYNKWTEIKNTSTLIADGCFLPLTSNGVLYPPNILNARALDSLISLDLTDIDLLMKMTSLISRVKTVLLPFKIGGNQRQIALEPGNSTLANNEVNISKVCEEFNTLFPEFFELLYSDDFYSTVRYASSEINSICHSSVVFANQHNGLKLLRDCALALEPYDKEKSLSLFSLAKQVKPTAPLVNGKIKKLKQELKNESNVPLICIIGCFRSGTNYLQTLLENNFKCEAKFNSYGWKHGVIPITNTSQETKAACDWTFNITKNPYSFLVSMYDYASNLNLNVKANTDNFSNFLKNKFVVYDGNDSNVELRFANPVEYWNSIVWNHNSNKEIIHIQYEELIKSANFEFFKQLPSFDLIPKTDEFFTPDFKVKRMNDASKYSDVNKHETKKVFKSDIYSEHRYLSEYNKDDFDFVLKTIDEDLIIRLGYEPLIEELKAQVELKLEA